ncbi:MAG: hypothetical protein FWD38_08675 [Oscillospiraceae bacterium]|nr:hypothetical protein [Oscillospiraceae bacterium]
MNKNESTRTTFAIMPNYEHNEAAPAADMQAEMRPNIDDIVCHHIEGENLKEALFIIDNIRENHMKIKWTAVNTWSVSYRMKHVCDLKITNGNLVIGKLSEVLITRVRDRAKNPETLAPLFDAMREMMSAEQTAFAAV